MLMETKDRIGHFEKEEQEKIQAFAAQLKNLLQLFDPGKIPTRNTSTYSRETLRTYLRNPATDSNNKNLRKLSNYLYTISHVYRRMINYKANQINCKVWSAYPIVNMVDENDEESILREYDRVTKIVNNMHMDTQINKVMLQAWKNGISYGYTYGDPEKEGSFYIHLYPYLLTHPSRLYDVLYHLPICDRQYSLCAATNRLHNRSNNSLFL